MRYIKSTSDLSLSVRGNQPVSLAPYERFCAQERVGAWPLNGQVFTRFLQERSMQVTRASLKNQVCAIRRRHLDNGWEDPLSNRLLQACYRVALRRCPERNIQLIQGREIAEFIDRIDRNAVGIRDIAIVLLIFCTRISLPALHALNRFDLHFTPEGMRIRAKYHWTKKVITVGRHADPRYCAVAAMERYLCLLQDEEPALFRKTDGRHDLTTCRLRAGRIKHIVRGRLRPQGSQKAIGLRQLHASAVMAALNRGASDYRIMRQFGYHSVSQVRRCKARCGSSANNLTEKLGL